MDQDLQFGMPGRVPLPQGFADAGRNASYDEAGLGRNEMAAESRAVSDFRVALGKIGDVNVVEDGKAGHVRGGISSSGGSIRNRDGGETNKREKSHEFLDGKERHCFIGFLFHFGLSIG